MNSTPLRTPSFTSEALLAAALALAATLLLNGSLMLSVLGGLALPGMTTGALAALVGVYLVTLCLRGEAKAGRVSLLVLWAAVALAAQLLDARLWLQCGWHLLAISATRSLLFYPRPLAFLADLCLGLGAGAAALWTLLHSHSLLLTIWSFFLVQAAWSWILERSRKVSGERQQQQLFDSAQANATAAIRRLTRRQRA